MFQSHLDDAPVMNMVNGLGDDPGASAPAPADTSQGSKDVSIPQTAVTLQKWKPIIAMAIIAVITYAIVSAAKKKKKKKKSKS